MDVNGECALAGQYAEQSGVAAPGGRADPEVSNAAAGDRRRRSGFGRSARARGSFVGELQLGGPIEGNREAPDRKGDGTDCSAWIAGSACGTTSAADGRGHES